MKKLMLWMAALGMLVGGTLHAQDITGDWQGTLELPASASHSGSKSRIVLRIVKAANGSLSALNYVIDQSGDPFATSEVTLQGTTFKYSIPSISGTYEGKLSADGNSITGTWTQSTPIPLNFVRATKETAWEIPAPTLPLKPMAEDADPTFEVATIKPNNSGTSVKIIRVTGRRYITRNTSLADLIEVSYGVNAKQIIGAPSWVNEDKFDLVAIPDGEGQPNNAQWLAMMRKLLTTRCKLAFHREKQPLSVYVLSIASNGPKNLTKSMNSNSGSSLEFRPGPKGLLLPAKNATLEQFSQMMQQVVLDRPVVDQTGITDSFDFQLSFTPDDSQFNGHPPSLPDTANASPSLFDALQQQLGLKLSAQKLPFDVIVIDHVEKPSEN